MRPVRFQSTAPTTNAYPSGSDWAPRSHRRPVERLSHVSRQPSRRCHARPQVLEWSPCQHGAVQQLSLGFGNRVQGAALRPQIVVFASIGAAEGQGLGSRGMAMPAGKDAVGGVASGVDLGGQALEHASVNVWRLGPDASERSCRGHGTTFHDQLRKCDSAEEEQLASEINSVLVIRLSATPSATSSLVPNVDTKQPPGRSIVTATGRSSASFRSCARSKDRLRLVVRRSCGSASP